ncbi:MAG: phosphate acyltransferase PlsX [Alphaproteobacteria bacterium]|nr:phosphate acyltransferase PlsX [Alphaproteobacteria bacterium]
MNTPLSSAAPSLSSPVIALDAMGGDFGPSVVIPGAALALAQDPALQFIFFGEEGPIRQMIATHALPAPSYHIVHAERVIRGDDKPSAALRASKGTSMRAAIEAVDTGRAQAVVSAGNTGALMALSMAVLKTLPGVHRPALASVFPGERCDTLVLDLGANVLVDSENLVQFAILGAVYAKLIKNVPTPRVGLLNVGTEETKGPDHVRAAAATLAHLNFHGVYAGFVEGTDLLRSAVDVIVCDGYAGNIALKTAEGVSKFTIEGIKAAINSDLMAKLGGLLAAPALRRFKKKIDPRLYNGALLLGLGGVAVKSHGGADALAFSSAVLAAARLARAGYVESVAREMNIILESGAQI